MITIDPLDDEVVKKTKPERSRSDRSRRSSQTSERADQKSGKKAHTSLLTIALRLLHGSAGKEE